MDNIYNTSKSDMIDLKKFFEQCKSNLNIEELPKNDADIMKSLGINDENELRQLEDSISLDTFLSQADDVPVYDYEPGEMYSYYNPKVLEISRSALKLKTFTEIIKFKEKQYGSVLGHSPSLYKFTKKPIVKPEENDLEPYSDIVITIRFYRPYYYVTSTHYGPKFSEEFLVLGSQYLHELKDRVSCLSNNKRLIDISDDPDQNLPPLETNSGFFFITDTFYNDTRNPKNFDYSNEIRKWTKDRREFKEKSIDNIAKMEETRFCDLNVCFGFPQLYFHNGNCEHVFTFSSVRLLSPQDILKREIYPILNVVAFPNAKLCNICGDRTFTYIVKNSKRQFHDPCYLCTLCFESFYYVRGKKVGEFEAYKLNDDDNASDTESELEEEDTESDVD